MTLEELYEDIYSRLVESEELSALIGENKIFDYTPYEDVKGPRTTLLKSSKTLRRIPLALAMGRRRNFSPFC